MLAVARQRAEHCLECFDTVMNVEAESRYVATEVVDAILAAQASGRSDT